MSPALMQGCSPPQWRGGFSRTQALISGYITPTSSIPDCEAVSSDPSMADGILGGFDARPKSYDSVFKSCDPKAGAALNCFQKRVHMQYAIAAGWAQPERPSFMAIVRLSADLIINMQREAEAPLEPGDGSPRSEAAASCVSAKTYDRWRSAYSGLKTDQAKKFQNWSARSPGSRSCAQKPVLTRRCCR